MPYTSSLDSNNIAAAVVRSRLDYCNSLLYGASGANLNKVQRVQNSLVRIILSSDIRSNAKQNLAGLFSAVARSATPLRHYCNSWSSSSSSGSQLGPSRRSTMTP